MEPLDRAKQLIIAEIGIIINHGKFIIYSLNFYHFC